MYAFLKYSQVGKSPFFAFLSAFFPPLAQKQRVCYTSAMPTTQQLVRKGRSKPKKSSRSPALGGAPQKSGVVLRVFVITPKKPNSAKRHCARVRLSNGKELTAYIPGMRINLAEHARVLIQGGGGAKDLPGVKYTVVRGTRDTLGDPTKRKHRSLFGASKPGKKTEKRKK